MRKELGHELECDDLVDVSGERERNGCGSGTDVEHALVAMRFDEARKRLTERRQPRDRRCCNPVRVVCEPSAHGIIVRHESTTTRRERTGEESILAASS